MAIRNKLSHVFGAHQVRRVAILFEPDVINSKKHTFFGDGCQACGVNPISQVTYQNAAERYEFFPQKSNLFEGQLSKVSGMRHDGDSGLLLRSGTCPKHS